MPSGGNIEPLEMGQPAHLAQPPLLGVRAGSHSWAGRGDEAKLPWAQLRPHRITGHAKLGGTHTDHRVQLRLRTSKGHTVRRRAFTKSFLSSARRGAPTPSLPSLFQSFIRSGQASPDIQHLP